ncbi:hypothetical protein ACFQX6_13830 [Streptosporangium lutulentum]
MSAGHCAEGDGRLWDAGVIEWTNWRDGQGTIKRPNQPTYYGDVSLMRTGFGQVTSPTIFIGGRDSSVKEWVGGRFSVRAREGDQYCIGGASPNPESNGQICRFKVTDIAWKVDYTDPKTREHDGTVRWVQVGKKTGTCPVAGDSGAPVYTFRQSDGYVVAKGIFSGGAGDDKPVQSTCVTYFTDFHDVMKAVGKDIYKK